MAWRIIWSDIQHLSISNRLIVNKIHTFKNAVLRLCQTVIGLLDY